MAITPTPEEIQRFTAKLRAEYGDAKLEALPDAEKWRLVQAAKMLDYQRRGALHDLGG